MKDFLINPAKTVAITGHRVLYPDFNIDKLKENLNQLIEDNYDTFLIGMALGFDTVCFQILEQIRKEKDIKIVACVPCLSQSYKFNKEQKKEYERLLSIADKKVIISEEYTRSCMQKRNQFMVDNASIVLAYIKRDFGGTKNTVKYAEKLNIKIIKLD